MSGSYLQNTHIKNQFVYRVSSTKCVSCQNLSLLGTMLPTHAVPKYKCLRKERGQAGSSSRKFIKEVDWYY